MAVELSYHSACDVCGTYASWTPLKSYAEALSLPRKLGWYVYDQPNINDPGKPSCVLQCVDCWNKVGKLS